MKKKQTIKDEYVYLDTITKQGMKGRKKQTNRMRLVLVLVCFIMTVSILVLQSIGKTREFEKRQTYGSWELAEYGIEDEQYASDEYGVTIEKDGREIVVGAVLTNDYSVVTGIGTVDDAVKEMGSIQLLDGAWPQKENEVAIEASVLNELNTSYELGQKLQLSVIEQTSETEIPLEDIEVLQQNDRLICQDRGSEEEVTAYTVKTEEFVLSGVINDYAGKWDSQGYWLLNGVVIAENAPLVASKVEEQHFYTTETPVSTLERIWLEKCAETEEGEIQSIVYNEAAYVGDTTQLLTNGMFFIVIFVISIYIVFQQFMTQLQKRSMYFTILQNLGAHRKQLFYMIKRERQQLLRVAFPVGCVSGVVFSFLAVQIVSCFYEGTIVFGFDVIWLLLGWLVEYEMITFCFVLPLYQMLKPGKGKKKKENIGKKKIRQRHSCKKQSLWSITLRHASYHKAEFFAGLGISILICVAMFFTFLIAYVQLFQGKGYEENGNGQYIIYGEEDRDIGTPSLKELDAINGVEYSVAGDWEYAQINYDRMKESRILNDKKAQIEEEQEAFEEQYNTVIYRKKICEKEAYYDKLVQQAESAVDMDKFLRGESVLMYIPDAVYCSGLQKSILAGAPLTDEEEETQVLEYIAADSRCFRKKIVRDGSLQVGDRIYLISADGVKVEREIGGIIRSFDPSVCWLAEPFEIIEISQEEDMRKGRYHECNVYTNEDASYNQTDKKMASLLQGQEWFNLRLEQQEFEQAGKNRMRVVLFVGGCLVLFSFFIQYTNNQSQLWKEQSRIGVLRTLGISNAQFYLLYVFQAILQVVLGLLIGMLCFGWATFLISSYYMDAGTWALISGGSASELFSLGVLNLRGFFTVALAGYPVGYHLIASIFYVILTILVYVLPVRKQLKKSITENIRYL